MLARWKLLADSLLSLCAIPVCVIQPFCILLGEWNSVEFMLNLFLSLVVFFLKSTGALSLVSVGWCLWLPSLQRLLFAGGRGLACCYPSAIPAPYIFYCWFASLDVFLYFPNNASMFSTSISGQRFSIFARANRSTSFSMSGNTWRRNAVSLYLYL